MHRKDFIIVLVFLVALISCNRSSKYVDFTDDLEHVALVDGKYHSEISNLVLGGEKILVKEGYSGVNSIFLDSVAPYGLNYKIKRVRTDEYVEVEVKYRGPGKLVLVAQDENADYYYRKAVSPDPATGEWKTLRLQVSIPPIMNGHDLNVYAWNADGIGVYCDDFSFSYEAVKKLPDYDPAESMHIYIDSLSLESLEQKRVEAFERGILVTEDDDYVDGIMFYRDTIMPIELRLKGDWLDHLEGRKWSFRIKVKKEFTWKRLKTFSLHTPAARDYMNEWAAHELYRQQGLLAPRYGFVPVTLNGKSLGIYAWEEHFEKQLLESADRREGPIVKFDESHFWKIQELFQRGAYYSVLPVLQGADIKAFKESRITADSLLYREYLIARDLMNQYRFLEKPASEIFDTERMGHYLALMDLTRGFHGLNWHNQRFYYNPVTSRLEPIFFDAYTDLGVYSPNRDPVSGLIYLNHNSTYRLEDLFLLNVFKDRAIYESYYRWLKELTNEKTLPAFIDQISSRADQYQSGLSEEFPDYKWDEGFLARNATAIRAQIPKIKTYLDQMNSKMVDLDSISLEHYSGETNPDLAKDYIKAYTRENKMGQTILEIVNYFPLKVQIIASSERSGVRQDVLSQQVTLPAYHGRIRDLEYKTLEVSTGTQYLFVRIENQDGEFTIPVHPFSKPSKETARQEISRLFKLNLPGLVKQDQNKLIFSGQVVMQAPLYIPSGYQVILEAGLELDMVNQAFLISESPVFANGEDDHPILIHSSDNSSMGFHVINAPGSVLTYTEFRGLNTLAYKGWSLTGAVNFYESTVDIDHCQFVNNHCEDALNIIRSDFQVKHSAFQNTFADAFDSDFCTGIVDEVQFTDIGNDAIDFSGSKVDIVNCQILQVGDKGVSCGEQSTLNVFGTLVRGANIAYASKDLSQLFLEDCKAEDAIYGLLAFQKKPEYGPGMIQARKFVATQVDTLHLVELASKVRINSSVINGQESKVAQRFY